MEIREIPLVDILPPRIQPRLIEDDPELVELEASIRRHGFWGTLVVRPDGERVRLLAGNRRLHCLKKIGVESVRCSVLEVDGDVGDQVTIVENLIRRDLSPVEEAYAFALYLDTTGATQEELAAKVGKERSYVTRRLMALDLDDDSLGAMEDGIITLSEGLLLRRVDDLEVRLKFISHADKYGCTARVMEYWVTGYLQQRDAMRRVENRELTAEETHVPREVMMRCDACSTATPYGELETMYMCQPCKRRVLTERLVRDG